MAFYYKRYGYRPSYSQSSYFNKSPKYDITLVNGAYSIKRDYPEECDGKSEDVLRYLMQSEYTGRLFTIMAKSLFYSIGMYLHENCNLSSINEIKAKVYLKVYNSGLYDFKDEYFYIKLNDDINLDIFKNELAPNEDKVIDEWADIMKTHPFMKPFLNKETEFISWDPGKGDRTSYIRTRIPDMLRDEEKKRTIVHTDPENILNTILSFVGSLKLKCGDTYAYDLLNTYYEDIKLKELHKLPFLNILEDKDAIDNISEDQAFEYAQHIGINYEYNKYTNKVEYRSHYYYTSYIPKKPVLGDRKLFTDGSSGAMDVGQYIKQEYPYFYNKVNDIINEVRKRSDNERHEHALKEYEAEHICVGTLVSNKQTNEYIKESFKIFKKVYNLDEIPEDPHDFVVYIQDLFGCVADYLSEKGSELLNEYMNRQQISYIQHHPRKKQFSFLLTNDVFNKELINSDMSIRFYPYYNELGDELHHLNNLVGGLIPSTIGCRAEINIALQNNKNDAEIIEKTVYKTTLRYVLVNNRGVELKFNVYITLAPIDVPLKKDDFYELDTPFNINPTKEMNEFKKRIYKELLSCYTGNFGFKYEDARANWEGEYPPYDIYMEYDEEKMNKLIEDLKKDPVYNELCLLKTDYDNRKKANSAKRRYK